MSSSIVRPKRRGFWIALNVAVVSSLIGYQYFQGDIVLNTYSSAADRFLDLFVTYLIVVTMIVIIIGQIMKSYAEQRNQEALHRREAEAARLEAEKANVAKSTFLATMSHEIRTPLNGITGMVSLLKETQLNKEQEELLGHISLSSDILMSLINDILDFSKIEAGNMDIEEADFSIHRCVEEVMEVFHYKAREQGLQLSHHIDPKVPFWLKGDSMRIKQVLINLVSNAVKFTPRGRVSVHVSLKNAGPEHAVLLFQVTDTGIGIPEEKIPFLFNSFTQGDSSTTRKYGGTGLGLAISERLVNLMGGHIEVESEPERGASFRFSIFCRLSAKTERPDPKEPEKGEGRENYIGSGEEPYGEHAAAEPERRLTILLAEDNAVNQKLVQLMLARLDLNADIAWNGVEAVQLYKAKRHDLVLMDILMPEMDGLEATRQIRASYDGESRPFIVALTANATQSDKENCLQAGMDEYLAKPIKREDFVAIIRSAALVRGKAEQYT